MLDLVGGLLLFDQARTAAGFHKPLLLRVPCALIAVVAGFRRELIVVVGVLASPEGVPFPVKDEHQYVAVGTLPGELFVMPGTEIDRSDRVHGYRADQILTMPIWRV